MIKWEYSYVVIPDENAWDDEGVVSLLNISGAEGWEFTGNTQDRGNGVAYLMKRISQERGSNAPKPMMRHYKITDETWPDGHCSDCMVKDDYMPWELAVELHHPGYVLSVTKGCYPRR